MKTSAQMVQKGGDVSVQSLALGGGNFEGSTASLVLSNGTASVLSGIGLAGGGGADGRLAVAGGSLSAPRISFGGFNLVGLSTNAFASIALSDGELTVGSGGISVNTNRWYWPSAFGAARPWYDVRLSGGVYAASDSHTNTVAMRLLGPATIEVPAGKSVMQQDPLAGCGSLTKTGGGSLGLSAANTYTGATLVAAGTLELGTVAALPAATAVWTADSLTGADGSAVTAWADSSSTWTFNSTLAQAIASDRTAPTLGLNRMNGHRAVIFNNSLKNALAITGLNATPAGSAGALTVAVTFRATAGAGSAGDWRAAAGLIGQQNAAAGAGYHWGLALDAAGEPASGIWATGTNPVTVWTSGLSLLDGQPHVVIFAWKTNSYLRVNVDGTRWSQTGATGENTIIQMRILLGFNEAGYSFGGEIADIRFYKDSVPDESGEDALGLALAEQYGATYTATTATVFTPETAADADAELPAASGVWTGDSLAAESGSAVTEWADTLGAGGVFTSTIGEAMFTGHTNPKIAAVRLNGHKAVVFDGVSDALGMTGAQTPAYSVGATNLTVAVVFRVAGAGSGTRESDWNYFAGILDNYYESTAGHWGIGLTQAGQIAGGIDLLKAFATPRGLDDGQPHVALFSFGTELATSVDGFTGLCPDYPGKADARTQTAMSLGAVRGGGHFGGEIAEIRFYKNTELTRDQRRTLGKQLAVKYGAETLGYCTNFLAFSFASREVTVQSNAFVMLPTGGYTITAGQCFTGAGMMMGRLAVGTNGVIEAAGGEAPVVSGMLAFQAGGILRSAFDAEGKPRAAIVTGGLELPAGEVTIDVRSATPVYPSGVILTWKGSLTNAGATWKVIGGCGQTSVVVDPVKKQVRLSTPSGTVYRLE